jgi:hypothetical protein
MFSTIEMTQEIRVRAKAAAQQLHPALTVKLEDCEPALERRRAFLLWLQT